MTDIEAAIGELLEFCKKHSLACEDIDTLVYDLTDHQASAINNSGEAAQLEFLLAENNYDINAVKTSLEHLAEEVTTEGESNEFMARPMEE